MGKSTINGHVQLLCLFTRGYHHLLIENGDFYSLKIMRAQATKLFSATRDSMVGSRWLEDPDSNVINVLSLPEALNFGLLYIYIHIYIYTYIYIRIYIYIYIDIYIYIYT